MKAKRINENLGDILKPKSNEEVHDALTQVPFEEKKWIVLQHYHDYYELLLDIIREADDYTKLVKICATKATRKELQYMVIELYGDNSIDDKLMSIIDSFHDEKQYYKIAKEYFDLSNNHDLEDVLDKLILKHNDLMQRAAREMESPY